MPILTRGLIALLAGLTLTAFAPAPLPRAKRDRVSLDSVRSQDIQGVWRALSIEEKSKDGNMAKQSWGTNQMRITGNRWAFCTDGKESFSLYMTLDSPRIDLRNTDTSSGDIALCGVLRRRGNTLQMMYIFGGPAGRPLDFDNLATGTRIMTLERER